MLARVRVTSVCRPECEQLPSRSCAPDDRRSGRRRIICSCPCSAEFGSQCVSQGVLIRSSNVILDGSLIVRRFEGPFSLEVV